MLRAEHGQELDMGTARLARDPPTTVFKNYWMYLKPGAMVYRSQHGLLSAYVINSVTGGTSDDTPGGWVASSILRFPYYHTVHSKPLHYHVTHLMLYNHPCLALKSKT